MNIPFVRMIRREQDLLQRKTRYLRVRVGDRECITRKIKIISSSLFLRSIFHSRNHMKVRPRRVAVPLRFHFPLPRLNQLDAIVGTSFVQIADGDIHGFHAGQSAAVTRNAGALHLSHEEQSLNPHRRGFEG